MNQNEISTTCSHGWSTVLRFFSNFFQPLFQHNIQLSCIPRVFRLLLLYINKRIPISETARLIITKFVRHSQMNDTYLWDFFKFFPIPLPTEHPAFLSWKQFWTTRLRHEREVDLPNLSTNPNEICTTHSDEWHILLKFFSNFSQPNFIHNIQFFR